MRNCTVTVLSIFTLLTISCETSEKKFDKEKWQIKENDNYKYRKEMVHDLVKNVELKGLTKDELINLLGKSENMWKTDKNLFYPILKKYDEPIHIIFLAIRINKKEIVDHFEIIDNRKIKIAPRSSNFHSLPIK